MTRMIAWIEKHIPEYELKKTVTMKKKGELWYVGAYYIKKRGGLAIKF